jgi:hypothetical protein
MAIKNDERILALREQIEAKKKTLGKQPRFSPVTTCMLDVNGTRINLHTLNSIDKINHLLVYLNMWVMSAEDMDIDPKDIMLSDFPVTEWMDDLAERISLNQNVNIEFTGSLSQLARVLNPVIKKEQTRAGARLIGGAV